MALCFGMVDFAKVASAGWFQVPEPLHFGIAFDPSPIVSMVILFIVNAVQAVGDFSATTMGGLDREPTDDELSGGIIGSGLSSLVSSVMGGLPCATYSQNVGIVATTKVVNRVVFSIAAILILVAGLIPKFSGILTTIPQCVLGGATISVFASITMTGIKLITTEEMNADANPAISSKEYIFPPVTKFRIGLIKLSVREVTILVKAPPMITPTAMSSAFPRRANALNSSTNFVNFSFIADNPFFFKNVHFPSFFVSDF